MASMTSDSCHERQSVLFSTEAECLVDALQAIKVKDIGSTLWLTQHEYFEKLNMQAIMNATSNENEFVKDALISADKMELVLYDLLATEVWKEKVFAEIVKLAVQPSSSVPLYLVLYHEATIATMLETVLYYRESCEACDDFIIDLVDSCIRQITIPIVNDITWDDNSKAMKGTLEELLEHKQKLQFQIAMKCISIMRYIIENREALPPALLQRVFVTHNVPVLFVQLMETAPWKRISSAGCQLQYVDCSWKETSSADRWQVTKIEGQAWFVLYYLLMCADCQQKYEFNSYNKECMLKLRAHLNEPLLDQLPFLLDMQRFLHNLAIVDPPAPKQQIIIEQIPVIQDSILRENHGRWRAIAEEQMKSSFNSTAEKMKEQAQKLVRVYDIDTLNDLIPRSAKCVVCGHPAPKRCSRCRSEWYCRRECQVKHWPKHKSICNMTSAASL